MQGGHTYSLKTQRKIGNAPTPYSGGDFGCLELSLYGTRERASVTSGVTKSDDIPSHLDLLGVLVADPGLVDQHPDATGGVGLGQLGQVLAVLRVRLETNLGYRLYLVYFISQFSF